MSDKNQRITIDVPIELYKDLKIACVENNCSMRDAFIFVIRKWVNLVKEKK